MPSTLVGSGLQGGWVYAEASTIAEGRCRFHPLSRWSWSMHPLAIWETGLVDVGGCWWVGCLSKGMKGDWHGETYAGCWGGRGAVWQEKLFADAQAHADGQAWEVASGHMSG